MATIIWTLFAVAVMIGIFASCVIVVAVGVRWIENALAKHRAKGAA